ncbi:MAG: hypothetical protein AAFS10_01790 [Myxococcota bacterium]
MHASAEPSPSAYPGVQQHLDALQRTLPQLRGAIFCDLQGDVIAASGREHQNVMAMTPFVLGLMDLLGRVCEDGGLGLEEMAFVRADRGMALLHQVGGTHLFAAFIDRDARPACC